MRTEAEVKEALMHLVQAAEGGVFPPEYVGLFRNSIDLLRWVLNQPSRFETEVMKPCRRVDQAARQ